MVETAEAYVVACAVATDDPLAASGEVVREFHDGAAVGTTLLRTLTAGLHKSIACHAGDGTVIASVKPALCCLARRSRSLAGG